MKNATQKIGIRVEKEVVFLKTPGILSVCFRVLGVGHVKVYIKEDLYL